MPTDPIDEELAQRLKRGDMGALGSLYERHAADVLRYLRARLRNDHAAEDVHSELWLRVGRRIANFTQGDFRAWLFTCARHLLIDFQRTRSAKSFAISGQEAELPARETAPLEEDDDVAALRGCLAKLGQQQPVGAFIAVRRMTGDKYPAICADFPNSFPGQSLEENRAYKLYFQARQWLRECIEATRK
jgi:hypothetical protein